MNFSSIISSINSKVSSFWGNKIQTSPKQKVGHNPILLKKITEKFHSLKIVSQNHLPLEEKIKPRIEPVVKKCSTNLDKLVIGLNEATVKEANEIIETSNKNGLLILYPRRIEEAPLFRSPKLKLVDKLLHISQYASGVGSYYKKDGFQSKEYDYDSETHLAEKSLAQGIIYSLCKKSEMTSNSNFVSVVKILDIFFLIGEKTKPDSDEFFSKEKDLRLLEDSGCLAQNNSSSDLVNFLDKNSGQIFVITKEHLSEFNIDPSLNASVKHKRGEVDLLVILQIYSRLDKIQVLLTEKFDYREGFSLYGYVTSPNSLISYLLNKESNNSAFIYRQPKETAFKEFLSHFLFVKPEEIIFLGLLKILSIN